MLKAPRSPSEEMALSPIFEARTPLQFIRYSSSNESILPHALWAITLMPNRWLGLAKGVEVP